MDMQGFVRAFIANRAKRSSRKAARGRHVPRGIFHSRPLDLLEDRVLLAANLAPTGITVVDDQGHTLNSISAGQTVVIQLHYTVSGLPANTPYNVAFNVNGLIQEDTNVTFGDGQSGTWNVNSFNFQASPGTNQVTVTVDPEHTIAESSFADNTKTFTFTASNTSVGVVSATVAQVRNFYGINDIPNFGTSSADGTGQTIALIDAANEPTILDDLDAFDKGMTISPTSTQTLYDLYGPASSFAKVYNQNGTDITANIHNSGSNGVPATDPTGHWEGEETLDVEWAHAIAPGAKLVIIEATYDANVFQNLLAANGLAASLPGVTVISNSWGMNDFSGETATDSSLFVTPNNHPGVTFLTASNDNGAFYYGGHGPITPENSYYPATSPNVVSVGGTQITLSSNGYGSETGWSFPPPDLTFSFSNGTQTGSWSSHSGGFNGNYGTAAPGSNTVSWTIPITPAITGFGTVVSATWVAAAGNATNATYNVYDGSASGTLLGTITVDQTKAPAGTPDGNRQFQELGVFFPTLNSSSDGTLTVVLTTSGATGNVVADAVGAAQGWAGTGGPSLFESEPSYQIGFQNSGQRSTPDVSLISSQSSGVTTYLTPLNGIGGFNFDASGTSLACPCWAGLFAIINQGRVFNGGSTFNSVANPQQALQALYSLPAGDYHDITTGYNGFLAKAGYDFVTGLGTPIANVLVPDMASYGIASNVVPTRLAFAQQPAGTGIAGQTLSHAGAVTPALVVDVLDAHGNIDTNDTSSVTITLVALNGATLGGSTTVHAVAGVATFSDLNVGLAGTGYKLVVTDGALTAATSSAFAVTPDIASSHLILEQQPVATSIGKPLSPAIVVQDVDRFGNLVITDHSKVVLTATGGTFTGATTVALNKGAATFSNIVFKTAGTPTIEITPAANATIASDAGVGLVQIITPATTVIPTPKVNVKGYTFGSTITLTDTLGSNVPPRSIPFNSSFNNPTLLIGGTDSAATVAFTPTGAAKFTMPTLDAGAYLCQIVYPGDINHASGNSSTFTVTINKAPTTTTLITSSAKLVFGQPVTLTAFVKGKGAPNGIVQTGSVEFLDNGTIMHTTAITGTSASYTFTPSATGSHNFQAIYVTTTDFAASNSPAKRMIVPKDKTTIQISAPTTNTSIPHGQSFSLDVQVSIVAPGTTSLAGDLVTIKDNGKTIGTVTLNGAGAGTLPGLSYTNTGSHVLSAIFTGDADALAATSPTVKVIST